MVGEVWRIGDMKISRIVEIEATGGMSRIIPDATRERVMGISWLYPHFADEAGRMRGAIHALLVETPDMTILVDTCIGNDKERVVPAWNQLQTAFLDDLSAAGKGREEIDRVLCTHLHTDHVGWNTMWVDGAWVPTFPNARYLYGAKEFAYWRDNAEGGQAQVMEDSVMPIWEAGLVDLVAQDAEIAPGVTLIPSPGHTPGHASVLIESQGETALITGDFLHHPVQMAHPEWSSAPRPSRPASPCTPASPTAQPWSSAPTSRPRQRATSSRTATPGGWRFEGGGVVFGMSEALQNQEVMTGILTRRLTRFSGEVRVGAKGTGSSAAARLCAFRFELLVKRLN